MRANSLPWLRTQHCFFFSCSSRTGLSAVYMYPSNSYLRNFLHCFPLPVKLSFLLNCHSQEDLPRPHHLKKYHISGYSTAYVIIFLKRLTLFEVILLTYLFIALFLLPEHKLLEGRNLTCLVHNYIPSTWNIDLSLKPPLTMNE